MYCPQCGSTVSDEYSFCPKCGMYLTVDTVDPSQTQGEIIRPEPVNVDVLTIDEQKESNNRSIKFLAILAVFILLAVLLFYPFSSEGSLNGKSFNESAEVADDAIVGTYYCVTPTSGFVDDSGTVATISFTDGTGVKNGLKISLSVSGASNYKWTIKGYSIDHKTQSSKYTDASPTISDLYGDCVADVTYQNSSGVSVSKELKFSVDLHRSYSWKYDGGKFSFDSVIDFDQTYNSTATYSYLKPTTDIIKKQTMNSSSKEQWSNTPDFIVVNDAIRSYADTLGKLYSSAYGEKSLNQGFADFLLGYVQICYTYGTDSSLYGYEEYFAFPLQTIWYTSGDCEDTSILTAAIASAAGFKAAVFLLPQHATVGIALDSYSRPNVSNADILSQTVNGVTYYSGETTVDDFQQLGVMGYYVHDRVTEHYSDYIGKKVDGYGTYGVYPVKT